MIVAVKVVKMIDVIVLTLKDDQMPNLTPAVDVNESIDCCKFTP